MPPTADDLDLSEWALRRDLKGARQGRACAIGFLRTPAAYFGYSDRPTVMEDPPEGFLARLSDLGLPLKLASEVKATSDSRYEYRDASSNPADLYLVRVVWSGDAPSVEQIYDGGAMRSSAWIVRVEHRGTGWEFVEQLPLWER